MKNELRGSIRLNDIDSLKGLAIIGVVLLHCSFSGRFDIDALRTINIFQKFFEWSVIAFFFASGITAKPTKDLSQLKQFLITRIKRLLIPYFIFCISYEIIIHLLAYFGLIPSRVLPIRVLDILRIFTEPSAPQLYFLPYLLLVASLAAAIEYFIETRMVAQLSGLALTLIYCFIPTPEHAYGADFILLPVYFYAYVAGKVVAASRENHIVATLIGSPIILSAILFKSSILLYAVAPIILFFSLCKTQFFYNITDFLKIGKKSSSIYFWHAPIALPLASIVSVKSFGGGIISIVPTVFLCVLICYGASYLAFKLKILKLWHF